MRKLIIFEGISGAGKSTIEDLYRKTNGYYDYTVHRLMASKYVYGVINQRGDSLKQLQYDEKLLKAAFPVRQILLTCDTSVAVERKQALNDPNIEEKIEEAAFLFSAYCTEMTSLKTLIIDTTENSPEKVLEKILRFTK